MYQEMPADRGAADEHAKTHLIAVRQGEFNLPDMGPHLELGEYYGSQSRMSRTAPDVAPFIKLGLALNDLSALPLQGVDLKADKIFSIYFDEFDIEGMKAGRTGSRIDLGLDPLDLQTGEGHPLPPTYDKKILVAVAQRCLRPLSHMFIGHETALLLQAVLGIRPSIANDPPPSPSQLFGQKKCPAGHLLNLKVLC